MNFYKDTPIEFYIRYYVHLKILKFLDKAICAQCGSKENLHIHHDKDLEFSTILYKSLEDLHIDYKEKYCDYTKDELKLLKTMILGYHLYGRFTILCKNCHVEYHKTETDKNYKAKYKFIVKNYEWQLKYYKNLFPDSTLEDFINNFNRLYLINTIKNFINIELYEDQKNELQSILKKGLLIGRATIAISEINNKKANISSFGINTINSLLGAYNISYRLKSFKQNKSYNRNKKYWVVEKIEE